MIFECSGIDNRKPTTDDSAFVDDSIEAATWREAAAAYCDRHGFLPNDVDGHIVAGVCSRCGGILGEFEPYSFMAVGVHMHKGDCPTGDL